MVHVAVLSFIGGLRLLTWGQLTEPSLNTIHLNHNNLWSKWRPFAKDKETDTHKIINVYSTVKFTWPYFFLIFAPNWSFVQMLKCFSGSSGYIVSTSHKLNSVPTSFHLLAWIHEVLWWAIKFLFLLTCLSDILQVSPVDTAYPDEPETYQILACKQNFK